MHMIQRKILVAGATGNQGGSVARALLSDGHKVLGISRNLNSQKSRDLIALGAEMVSVSFSDQERLIELMTEVDTVFAMTTPFEGGEKAEIEQGKTMVNAAQAAGIGHFIFNSVGDADLSTGIPHFDSKYEVEKHLSSCKPPYTIVGPSYFMDNLFFPFNIESLKEGALKMAMPGDRVLQQISVQDIGRFVAMVVNEREEMFGKRINISGDEISGNEVARILSKVIGREISYEGFSPDYMKEQSEDMALMYQWFIDQGYTAKLSELQEYTFMSFEQWAMQQDWSQIIKSL
jgi:uncharacterized protein YbjT (DUF2867 family)